MFNPKEITNRIIEFIKNYFKENNLKGVVLGISGGKDSAVAAGLFCRALGKENVIGVTLPCHSKIEDEKDAKVISDYYEFRLFNLDLTNVFDAFTNEFNKSFENLFSEEKLLKDSNINLKPRLRMASFYYLAQAFSHLDKAGYIVAGTSNKCELYVGYFTKGGDNVNDINVLSDLTVDEVIAVGEFIGVPKEVLYKTPSDGISDLTDEDKLGVKYKDIAKVINKESVPKEVFSKIEMLNKKNHHKFVIPTFKK